MEFQRRELLCCGWRLEELLHIAGQQDFHIACIQGTQLAFNTDWRTSDWQVFSLSKSRVSISDGCIIATRSPTISPSCVKAIHRWEPGRVLGLRIQIGQGCSQLDLYVLNSYSPTNSQEATSEAREAHELSRAAHWQKCERVLRRIPRRCELVWAMDGNARMGTALPCVGGGGSRSKHREVWNCNGGDLFDILKEHHLKSGKHVPRNSGKVMDLATTSLGQADPAPAGLLHSADVCTMEVSGGLGLSSLPLWIPRPSPSRPADPEATTIEARAPKAATVTASISRRDGRSWPVWSDERVVREKVAVAASVIRTSLKSQPRSGWRA